MYAIKNTNVGELLAVQWLGLCAFTTKRAGSIPGQGTEILQAEWHGPKKKKLVFILQKMHLSLPFRCRVISNMS